MSRLRDRVLNALKLRPVTNRDQALEELYEMSGEDFFIRTGLVFNEDVMAEIQRRGMTLDEWLDAPAGRGTIFEEGKHGEVQRGGGLGGAEALL